jgi:RNA polymerase sigma-70 factor, ECF subfamily
MMQSLTPSIASNPVSTPPAVAAQRARPVYCGRTGRPVDRYDFDAHYVRQLTEGEPSVEEHFVSYFSPLLRCKLQGHGWSSEDAEDIRQDTFLRVLLTLRQKSGLDHPERLGAFVLSVCNNVALEFRRARVRHPSADQDQPEMVDETIDIHGALVAEESKKLVRRVLDGLPEPDRALMRAVFIEEASREEICRRMNVDRDYLRVLLHRARGRFRMLAENEGLDVNWKESQVPLDRNSRNRDR